MSPRWQKVGPPGCHGRSIAFGHGRDVVFLASPLARGESYVPTAKALARYFRAHLVEMPGSGASARLNHPWVTTDYASWAHEVIAGCGLAGSPVIGHSYSGMVAVALAVERPESVGAVVVSDTPGFGEPPSLLRGIGGAAFDAVLDFGLVLKAGPHVVSNAIRHCRNFLGMIRESVSADLRELARRVTVPALVTWGGKSQVLRPTAAATLAACLPDSRVYVSSGRAHTWVVSQPEEFASVVAAFLTPTER